MAENVYLKFLGLFNKALEANGGKYLAGNEVRNLLVHYHFWKMTFAAHLLRV